MQKFNINRGVVSTSYGRTYYKIAVTPSGYRLLKRECNGYDQAQTDGYFTSFLPEQNYRKLALIRPVLKPLSNDKADVAVTSLYNIQVKSKKMASLNSVLDQNFMSYMPKHIITLAENQTIQTSVSHGDVHAGNMFEHQGKPLLIDWGGYQTNFWNRYDMVHYYFCSIENSNLKLSEQLLNSQVIISEMNNRIPFKDQDLITYVICRNSLEASQDRIISQVLYKKRICKYVERIKIMLEALK